MPDISPAPFDQGLFLVHLNRGREHFQLREYKQAEVELEQARSMRPTNEMVLNLLGLCYFKQEKYGEAEGIYAQLIECNRDSSVLHFNQGLVCFKNGALDRAEAALLRALELSPENAKVSFYLGNIYEKKQQYYNAIFQYRKAGAAMMVKRVQAKIEASRETTAATEPGPAPPPLEGAFAEANFPPTPPPEADEGPAFSDFKITVDHIDRERFLTALRQIPAPPALSEGGTLPPQEVVTLAPLPGGLEPGTTGRRTVVEMSEPVVADIPLSEMTRGKVLSDAADSLFVSSPGLVMEPPAPVGETEDTVRLHPPKPAQTWDRRLATVEGAEREKTQLYSKLRRRDDIFRYLENNLMEVNFSGKVFVKQGTIYSYSGNLTFWVRKQRPDAVSPLIIVTGTGRLLLCDREREITVLQINDEEVFVEPSHLLACQDTLTPRYASVKKEGQSHPQLDVLVIQGSGMMALSVATSPLLMAVTPGYPVSLSSANVISWSGDLIPSLVDDEALDQLMFPHGRQAVNLRLDGSGQVMIEKLTR